MFHLNFCTTTCCLNFRTTWFPTEKNSSSAEKYSHDTLHHSSLATLGRQRQALHSGNSQGILRSKMYELLQVDLLVVTAGAGCARGNHVAHFRDCC